MLAVPAVLPFTTPEVPTVAIAGLLLLHVPPVVTLANVVVSPTHTDAVPVIGETLPGFTDITLVVAQPVGSI